MKTPRPVETNAVNREGLPPGIQAAIPRLHAAFALMSVIPLLICCYVLTARLFSIDILTGLNGVYFSLAVIIALLGLFIGRHIIQEIVRQLVEANAKARRLVHELGKVNEQLAVELNHRKRSEEQLKQANTELAQRQRKLQEVVADLKKSHGDLKATQLQLIQVEKLESVGRLAAGVAHEVKNPLAIVLMGVNFLSSHLGGGDESAVQTLKDMDDAVRRADAVIKGLLDFSASKTLALNLEDLNAIVERTCLLVKHELDKAHVTLMKTLGENLPMLRLDVNKMQQLLINLLMNAIYAMPEGGTLTVRTYPKALTGPGSSVGSRKTDQFAIGETAVVTEVEDTGTGIPADQLPKIFDPFFTTKPTGQGTGLGLTVVRNIVDLHGGTIDVQSREGRGVKVTILLKVRGPAGT